MPKKCARAFAAPAGARRICWRAEVTSSNARRALGSWQSRGPPGLAEGNGAGERIWAKGAVAVGAGRRAQATHKRSRGSRTPERCRALTPPMPRALARWGRRRTLGRSHPPARSQPGASAGRNPSARNPGLVGLARPALAQLMIENYAHVLAIRLRFWRFALLAEPSNDKVRGWPLQHFGPTFVEPASPAWRGARSAWQGRDPGWQWAWPGVARRGRIPVAGPGSD